MGHYVLTVITDFDAYWGLGAFCVLALTTDVGVFCTVTNQQLKVRALLFSLTFEARAFKKNKWGQDCLKLLLTTVLPPIWSFV